MVRVDIAVASPMGVDVPEREKFSSMSEACGARTEFRDDRWNMSSRSSLRPRLQAEIKRGGV